MKNYKFGIFMNNIWNNSSKDNGLFFRDIEDSIYEEDYMITTTPSMYNIVIIQKFEEQEKSNSLEFISYIFEKVFFFKPEEIKNKIEEIKDKNLVICGCFTKDISETKVAKIFNIANKFNNKINCVIQKDNK